MKTTSFRCALQTFTVLAFFTLASSPAAFAAARTWTGNATTSGNFATAGNWDGSTDIASGDSLTFGALGTGGWRTLVNNLPSDWTVAGMTFNSSAVAYTINPYNILPGTYDIILTGDIANNNAATQAINLEMTLSGIRTVTTFAGSEIILGERLKDVSGEGTGSLTKAGTGILTLNGANTYDGDTTVDEGTLRLGPTGAIPNGAGNGNLIVNASGTFDLNANSEQINGLSGGGIVTNSAATLASLLVGDNNQTTTFSGAITGNLSLEKVGTGTLTLNGSNTYSGDTTVTTGTLKLGPNNALPNGAGKGNVIVNGTLDMNGSGEIINGLSGTTTGIVDNSSANALTLQVGDNDATTTFDGVIMNTGGAISLEKIGNGTLTLRGPNSYSGNTTIIAGTLQLGVGNVIPNGAVKGDVIVNGTMDMNGYAEIINGLSGTGTVDNSSANATSLLVGDDNRTTAFTGTIQNTGGGALALDKVGAGTLTLSGANTFSGDTKVSAGALVLGNTNALSGSTLDTSGNGTVTFFTGTNNIGGLKGNGSLDNGGNLLSVGANDQSTTYSGVLSGNGSLTKVGNGTLTLSGENTYTGATSIGGTLHVSSLNNVSGGSASSSLGAPVTVANGTITFIWNGGLNYTGSGETTDRVIHIASTATGATIQNIGSGGLLKFTSDLTASGTGSKTLVLAGTQAGEFAGRIVDSTEGGATGVRTSGIWTLSGNNTYSGNTTVEAGTLKLGGANVIPNGPGKGNVEIMSGSTLDLNGWSVTLNGLIGNGLVDRKISVNATLTVGDNDQTSTFSGMIKDTASAGDLSLTKIGNGTLTLSGNNTFYGDTNISAGALTLGSENALSVSTLNTTGMATLNLFGGTNNIGGLTGNGSLDTGGNLLSIGANNRSTTYSGVLSGTGGLKKVGLGHWVLAGNNTFTGGFTLDNGTVWVEHANALGVNENAVTINGGTLSSAFTRAHTLAQAITVGGNFTLGFNGTEKLTLTGPMNLGNATRTITVDNAANTISGVISNGGLTKAGLGTLTLSGANTYAGDTTISAGTLQLGASNALASGVGAGNVSVDSGATLDLNAFSQTINGLSGSGTVDTVAGGTALLAVGGNDQTSTFAGVIKNTTGTLSLTKIGTGTLTLSGNNTFTGDTVLSAGTLTLGSENALAASTLDTTGAGSVAVFEGINNIGGLKGAGNLDNGGNSMIVGANSQSTTYSGQIIGTGSLTKVGVGVLALSNANTFAGDTLVSEGTLALLNSNALLMSTLDTSGAGTVTLYSGTNVFGGLNGTGNLDNGGNSMIVGGPGRTTTYSGVLSGEGGLSKIGNGTLTLAGANTYAGNTTITLGTLKLGASDAISNGVGKGNVIVNVNGTLDLGAYDQTLNGLSDSGTVDKSGAGTSTLTVGNNDQTSAFFGVIQNTSGTLALTKTGTGILNLLGNNTYTGATNVNEGTLLVNGNQSSANGTVTVASGATLGGNGTVGGATIISGTHTPGNSPGLQTFESNLTYENGSTVVWELNSNTIAGRGTNFDGIDVANILTFTGTTTLNLVFNAGSTVDWNDTLWSANQEWLFFDVFGSTTGTMTLGGISNDSQDISLSTVRPNASFSVITRDNDLYIAYTLAETGPSIWQSGTSSWNVAGNWINGLPTADRAAIITNGGTSQVTTGISGTYSELTVGESSGQTGTLEISGGTLTGEALATLGKAANSQGTANVTGGSWNPGVLLVGDAGTGILNINGGSVNVAATVNVAQQAGSNGTVTVSEGGLLGTQVLYLGELGTGVLNISGGSVNSGSLALIGDKVGAVGTVNVSGNGSWTNSGNVYVGVEGAGVLNISGGTVTSGQMILGGQAGSTGSGNMTGGSLVSPNLHVGYGGTGALTVQGGVVSSDTADIATGAGSEGTATVTGGTWTNSLWLTVGSGGNGTLSVDGGAVSSAVASIGKEAGSGGTATVSSGTLSLSGHEAAGSLGLVVGDEGAGALNINGTGNVSVLSGNGTVMLAASAGSTGTLNLGAGGAAGTLDAAEVTGGAGTAVVNFNHTAAAHTFAPNLTGSLSVNQIGNGTTVLTGTNTYAGATTVSAGILLINGSNGPSTVAVASGATLGGNGTVGGATTISGTHTPGNSPGLQTFESNLTYEDGSTVVWELNDNTAAIEERGINFDGITVGVDLTFNGTTTLSLVFNGIASTVEWSNDLWATDHDWLFFNVAGITQGTLTMGVISADKDGFLLAAVRPNASFSVTSSGGNILVSYTAVPEPRTWALLAASLTLTMIFRRRQHV